MKELGTVPPMAYPKQASAQPFLILLLIPPAYLLFCLFTVASKNEVPFTGTQEPGATFVTAQTGTVLLA